MYSYKLSSHNYSHTTNFTIGLIICKVVPNLSCISLLPSLPVKYLFAILPASGHSEKRRQWSDSEAYI